MNRYFFIITLLITITMNSQIQARPSIDVKGEGIVTVIPDQVIISVRVEHSGTHAKEVKQLNDAVVNEVFQYLKKSGIEAKDVKTEYLNLIKNYDYNTKKYNYAANQSITIKLKDLSKYETLMNGLLDTGINRIDGISFGSSKMEALQSEARVKAIQNAKLKAEEYASVLNQSIGKALLISEFNDSNTPRPMLMGKMAMDSASSSQTIALGEMEIRVEVNVSFELN